VKGRGGDRAFKSASEWRVYSRRFPDQVRGLVSCKHMHLRTCPAAATHHPLLAAGAARLPCDVLGRPPQPQQVPGALKNDVAAAPAMAARGARVLAWGVGGLWV